MVHAFIALADILLSRLDTDYIPTPALVLKTVDFPGI
jgi:hypothetical protein